MPPLQEEPSEVMRSKRPKTASRSARLTTFQWLGYALARSRALAGLLACCLLYASTAGVLAHHCAGDIVSEARGVAALSAADPHAPGAPTLHADCVACAWLGCERSQPPDQETGTGPSLLSGPALPLLPPAPSRGTPLLRSSRGPPVA